MAYISCFNYTYKNHYWMFVSQIRLDVQSELYSARAFCGSWLSRLGSVEHLQSPNRAYFSCLWDKRASLSRANLRPVEN
jgi:hypothetical protein